MDDICTVSVNMILAWQGYPAEISCCSFMFDDEMFTSDGALFPDINVSVSSYFLSAVV